MKKKAKNAGFSLLELIVAMTILMILLGLVSTLFSSAMNTRQRESRRTDALTSSQAALNVISREIANSGFGMTNNGLVIDDSNQQRIHFRSNISNLDASTTSPGEDITYFYDLQTESIVRYDPNDTPKTSAVVNRISNVTFQYFDYTGTNSNTSSSPTPSENTGRIRINVTVQLENVQGQPANQTVTLTSDVTLRNSTYMLNQY